ncbi:ABC transporter ATP-binding protein [Zhenhengia yiwuensis]|jgi:putative ABC transport system ATP-binding protein|uniref:ABC transporter ATP-binding protein n=1 Tax=Zhenhengia yiwuensis TaxID=2763666 RepID=UPI002A74DE2B|nr:ABC transporter ATP-binding protein [Zhenhengia yiwuensis]MBS5315681.1 ABC transporter ATP-binding protein [Clostridiales bacterium]MDY3367554.1 ABC transporter ATP-binding protein [Zhenhengia yiwuensis]
MSASIQVKGLRKVYHMGKEKIIALNHVDLEIEEGEICCLFGTSGSGKSTLLNMLAGLEKPTKGSIKIKNERVDLLDETSLATFRQKYIGFVFQSYNLIPSLTALENVSLPLIFQGMPRVKREKRAKEMLRAVGLKGRMKHKPKEMSGGQQQRVSIARAFVNRPTILFADEPTGNLDTHTTIEVMEMIRSIAREYNQTLIIVSHDPEIADYADRIITLIDGNIHKIEVKKGEEKEIVYEIKE